MNGQRSAWIAVAWLSLLPAGCRAETPPEPDATAPRIKAPAAVERDDPHRFAREDKVPELTDLGTRRKGQDWPRFLGPTGDGHSAETGLIVPWPAAGPKLVWQQRLGESYAAPTIARGRCFIFQRFNQRGAGEATLTCLNAETGAALWNFSYPTDFVDPYGYDNGPRCCPVVDDDRVYLYGAEGLLHCLAAADGRLLWRCDTFREFHVVPNFFGVGSTPLVEGDLLLVQVGGSPPDGDANDFQRLRGNGSAVVAFDKLTGKIRYQLADELASYASPVAATIGDRRWCFVFARGGLLAFDPVSGKIDFHYPWRAPILESVNASNPVVAGNRVLISETYGPGSSLLEVRPGGFDVVWSDDDRKRDKILQTHWNTPVLHEGYVYASSGRHTNNAELRCVELATGKVMWSEPNLTRASLTYVDGHLLCLCEYGELILLRANPQKFDVVSRATLALPENGPAPLGAEPRPLLGYPCWAAPVVSHGLLYLRGANRLACLEIIAQEQ
ncbi:MAG: PQQ-like beta-propeller repeat protein [Pirellulales bacterium]|nr:PQQ-like beta-propeller repeat protein [Pirellulales bacterium]